MHQTYGMRLTQRARSRFPDAERGKMSYSEWGIDRALMREAFACQYRCV